MKLRLPADGLSSNALIALVALFVVACSNLTFFANVLAAYPISRPNLPFIGALFLTFLALHVLVLALVGVGYFTKPLLMVVLLFASVTAYFMDTYGVVIDEGMLQNAVQTNAAESLDLLTGKLIVYLLLLGVLPALVVARVRVQRRGWRHGVGSRLSLLGIMLSLIAALVLAFSSHFASFLREHKPLRSYANPFYAIYSNIKYANHALASQNDQRLAVLGADAKVPASDHGRELIILVVGETARADRFSINGYERVTTPVLEAAKAISFPNFSACGTSTAVSVPCMFSMDGRDKFDLKSAGSRENLLDVLKHAGVNVIWLDNNSDSKGVALRVPYQNFKTPALNLLCDTECRDVGMLPGLQDYIDSHPVGDIFIVLHQMGNHGPAYFKRYPPGFEKFTPACQSNDLGQCSDQEISNAYDNAIRYTDYFLGKTIALLQRNDANFETALFYVSDHGESLGENGIYLHGMPRAMAPEQQLHVPAVLWLGSGFHDVDKSALEKFRQQAYSHDNVVHTVLGLMEVKTTLYRPELDLLACCKVPE
ncbi:MAG: phosphoethanolamine--lipid A transferase [Rhodocyclaceae bacterium]|nr:phosphoethanolamine--lipid A transferase [Rhodocyclaceae bacterium]